MFNISASYQIRLRAVPIAPVSDTVTKRRIAAYRLQGIFSIGVPYGSGNVDAQPFYVDTGAPLTILRQEAWGNADVDGRIEHWIVHPEKASELTNVRGLGGGFVPAGLAVVKIFLSRVGSHPSFDEPMVRTIVAKCALDRTHQTVPMPASILGIGGGALDVAGLCLRCDEVSSPVAHLVTEALSHRS